MNDRRQLICRVLIYTLGLLFLAFSVAFSANSGLGISPVNAVPYAVSCVTKAELGLCVAGVFSIYVLIQILLLRKNFRWHNLFQLVFSAVFGYFTGFAQDVLGDFCLPAYPGQLAMLLISICCIAVGISLYVDAKLIPMPAEGLTLALSERLRVPFNRVKTVQDCLSVALAAAITLVFSGRLEGVKEGTLIAALLVGFGVKLAQRGIAPLVDKLCFSPTGTVEEGGTQ